jgi:hypothetical protein
MPDRPQIQPFCFINFPLTLPPRFADTAHSDGIFELGCGPKHQEKAPLKESFRSLVERG